MRIIGGTKKGILIQAPASLPVRPTTDRSKESLFNILANRYDFEGLVVLDLFSGTGNIAYEFASRGASEVVCVDADQGCTRFIKQTAEKMQLESITVKKQDAFVFLKGCENTFDIIFADAPYALNKVMELPQLVAGYKLLKDGGLLIIEHVSNMDLSQQAGFAELRKYGQSSFSFFTTAELRSNDQ